MTERKGPLREEDREIIKSAFREVLREWLDEKYTTFGKWSAQGIMALTFVAVVWLILTSQGWHR